MFLYRDDHALHWHREFLRYRLNDAKVGLMRHQPVDRRMIQLDWTPASHRRCGPSSVTASLNTSPPAMRTTSPAGIVPGRRTARRPAGAIEQMSVATIGVQMRRDDAGLFRWREHHGAGAVSEQDRSAAIAMVDDARKHLGSDHERSFGLPGAHELVGHRQRIDEAAAGGFQAEGRRTAAAEPCLQQAAAVRKYQIRRGRAVRDQIDIFGRDTG